jgi:predicted Zn-dependent protease
MKRTLLSALALATAGIIASCDVDTRGLTPIIGEQNAHGLNALVHAGSAISLSEQDEPDLGESIAVAITNQYHLTTDERLARYVALVGLTVASASPNPSGNWVFGVLETPEVNAFSTPNGYVFVTRGALMRMQDEAELAGVFAHEIGHVCHHDGLNQIKAAEWKSAAVEGSQANARTAQLSGAADAGLNAVTNTAYSQPQESAADAAAVQIVYAAGYDPHSFLRFIQNNETGGGGFSTHPGGAKRAQTISAQIAKLRPGGATMAQRFTFVVRGGR